MGGGDRGRAVGLEFGVGGAEPVAEQVRDPAPVGYEHPHAEDEVHDADPDPLDRLVLLGHDGAQALPLVSLISFLVGMILAFAVAKLPPKPFGCLVIQRKPDNTAKRHCNLVIN